MYVAILLLCTLDSVDHNGGSHTSRQHSSAFAHLVKVVLTDVSVTALPLLWLLQFSLDHD
jgi:hypothetical protein